MKRKHDFMDKYNARNACEEIKKKKILSSIYIYKKIKKFFIERVMKMFVNNLYSV